MLWLHFATAFLSVEVSGTSVSRPSSRLLLSTDVNWVGSKSFAELGSERHSDNPRPELLIKRMCLILEK